RGGGPADLRALTLELAGEMLCLAGRSEADVARLPDLLDSGAALACFRRNVERQGGDPRVADDPARLGRAPVQVPVEAGEAGHVADIDPLAIGLAVRDLGGGRRQPGDAVDPLVGIVLARARGASVARGDLLATVHARDRASAERAAVALRAAITIGARPEPRPLVVDRVR